MERVIAGFVLLVRLGLGFVFIMSIGMGVLFTFVLVSALYRHLDISCGCFSNAGAGKISYLTLIRAIVITLVSTGVYVGAILLAPKQLPPPVIKDKLGEQAEAQRQLSNGALLIQG